MRVEAFTEGKHLDDPEANEDQLLVLPGRGFAVIDGVTDISGRTFDGARTGRLASSAVQRAAADFLGRSVETRRDPQALVECASQCLRELYARYGLLDEARVDPTRRFGATLTIAVDLGETFRFSMIGDSGLRLNAEEVIVVDTGLDQVTASLRQEAYRLVAQAGGDIDAQRRVSRACSYQGAANLSADMQPWLDATRLAELHRRALARCKQRFPHAPLADIERLLASGIGGQTWFQNTTRSPFGYAVLDGFDVPLALVRVVDRPRASLRSIELYTDGYFATGRTAEVAAWEEAFAGVEAVDPEKIDAYPSVKGSSARMRTDDRTVVIVHL